MHLKMSSTKLRLFVSASMSLNTWYLELFLHGNKWGGWDSNGYHHYDACGSFYTDVKLGAIATQITSLTIVY